MIVNPRLAVLYVGDQGRTLEFLTGTPGFELAWDASNAWDAWDA
ncbi:hypothetical protein ACFYOK_03240 [Microbispora bryophytorum]